LPPRKSRVSINAIHQIDRISRKACREEFEKQFTRKHMVDNYESLYYGLSEKRRLKPVTHNSEKSFFHVLD
jgi:hypothetical protein